MASQDDLAALEAAEREQESVLSEMISDTEGEIFTDATGSPEDDNDGDRSLEEMEDPAGDDPAEDADPVEAEAEGEEQGEVEEEQPRIPPQRLREEAEARRAIERENADLRARLDRIEAAQRQQTAAPKAPDPIPDMFADPEGYTRHIQEQARQAATREASERFLNYSMAAAHEEHGSEFEYAYQQLVAGKDDPRIQAEAHRILAAPNPGRALMRWAEPILAERREQQNAALDDQLAQRFGVDPDTLNRALAMIGKAGGRAPARPSRNLPSLNSASGGGTRTRVDPRGMDGSESSIFEDAFRP